MGEMVLVAGVVVAGVVAVVAEEASAVALQKEFEGAHVPSVHVCEFFLT